MAGVACVLMALSSCEKQVIGEDGMEASETEEAEGGSARLSVITRAPGDPNENAVSEGRIYIMNSTGTCVEILSTDEESNQATTRLAAGQYTLYAIGGDDLSRFSLPTKSGATANSVITRLEGKVMADLLLASAALIALSLVLLDILMPDRVLRTFSLGAYMEKAGYDWLSPDLEDLDLRLSLSVTGFRIISNLWDEPVSVEVII